MRPDDDCPQTDAVIDAYTRDRLVAEATLSDHVGRCRVCASAVADLLVRGSPGLMGLLEGLDGLDVLDDDPVAPDERVNGHRFGPELTENEAALFAAEGFTSTVEPDALSARDRYRLDRLMDAMQAPRAPRPDLHVVDGGDADPPRPARRPARRAVRRWAGFAIAAAALMAVGLALMVDDGAGEATPDLAMRGSAVGLELGVGETRCTPGEPGATKPCAWSAGSEALTLHVRVEPHAKARHLVVVARDSTGDVTVLYPESGKAGVPLEETRSRASDTCRDALCWLEGGRYEVPPGQLSVVALFAERPLDARAFSGDWAPEDWSAAVELVERFELEVVH